MFRNKPKEFDLVPPMDLGKYGISKNRLNKLLPLLAKYYEPDESDLDPTNKWRYVDQFEADFNNYRLDKFTMGWLMAADELMIPFEEGKEGDPTLSVEPYIADPSRIPSVPQ
jgi:hypothetical protein